MLIIVTSVIIEGPHVPPELKGDPINDSLSLVLESSGDRGDQAFALFAITTRY